MELRFFLFILYITLMPLNAHCSQGSSHAMASCDNLPFLTGFHVSFSQSKEIHATYHLTTSNDATKEALFQDLFSQEKREKLKRKIMAKSPYFSENEFERFFQNRQQIAFEQATNPQNFAMIENCMRAALCFNFINRQTVRTSLALSDNIAPFASEITMNIDEEFSPAPPVVIFNAQEQTITQVFKTQLIDAPQGLVHASWLYMNKEPFMNHVQNHELARK